MIWALFGSSMFAYCTRALEACPAPVHLGIAGHLSMTLLKTASASNSTLGTESKLLHPSLPRFVSSPIVIHSLADLID
jgi:hypothetical protein